MGGMATERLQKLIANAGLCSRRQAEQLLDQGLVQVNGAVAQLGDRADPERDRITVRGEPLAARPQPLLLLLNKPPPLHVGAVLQRSHFLLPFRLHLPRGDEFGFRRGSASHSAMSVTLVVKFGSPAR